MELKVNGISRGEGRVCLEIDKHPTTSLFFLIETFKHFNKRVPDFADEFSPIMEMNDVVECWDGDDKPSIIICYGEKVINVIIHTSEEEINKFLEKVRIVREDNI